MVVTDGPVPAQIVLAHNPKILVLLILTQSIILFVPVDPEV
jgi:hypothetical protein